MKIFIFRCRFHTLAAAGLLASLLLVSPKPVVRADPAPLASKAESTTAAPAPGADRQPAPSGPLTVTVSQAVVMCLENSRSLAVQRLAPHIQQTYEDQQRAMFDPILGVDAYVGRVEGERLARTGSETEAFVDDEAQAALSLTEYFPSGTKVSLAAGTEMTDSSLYDDSFYETRFGLTVNQALLRGLGRDVNLVELRQARIDTQMSEYEVRGFSISLVAEVENTFWDYALAGRQIEIVEESLKVARQQLDETGELIAVGRLARSELAAVQAEVAAQQQSLIEARADRESKRLQLLRLLNPEGPGLWDRAVELVYQPRLPEIHLAPVAEHVAVAMRLRPLLNQARLEIQRGDLALVKTRNGLLPLLDLFATLGKSGYANAFGDSVERIDGDSYDALAGVRFSLPVFNRDAKARHRRALISRDQSQKALDNLTQLVEVDVRTACIEVDRTKQQIAASSATRRFDEEKLRTETEKLRVGKSTSFLVAQAQRDLLASRIAEVRALVNYIKALVDLYRLDGSLLDRRGVAAPGKMTVE